MLKVKHVGNKVILSYNFMLCNICQQLDTDSQTLSYYIVNNEEVPNCETDSFEWGIRIDMHTNDCKTIYSECVEYVSSSYEVVLSLVELFIKNSVTPCSMKYVLEDVL